MKDKFMAWSEKQNLFIITLKSIFLSNLVDTDL